MFRKTYPIHQLNKSAHAHSYLITKVTLDILGRRPAHHGVPHALRVAALAAQIASPDLRGYIPLIRICALAHDIDDSKFESDAAEWDLALPNVPKRTKQFILDIAHLTSFSRELNRGRADWIPTLGAGVCIRAVVSDADKLDSLGATGHQRLVEYNSEKLATRGILPSNPRFNTELRAMIEDVIDTRQRILARYMQTRVGQTRAPELFRELVARHRVWATENKVGRNFCNFCIRSLT